MELLYCGATFLNGLKSQFVAYHKLRPLGVIRVPGQSYGSGQECTYTGETRETHFEFWKVHLEVVANVILLQRAS